MKPAILFSAFVLLSFTVFSQQSSIVYDTVVIKLLITDYNGKPLPVKVNVENKTTHKITTCHANKQGKAVCRLATDGSYRVTISNSADSYEYNIPDISISPVELSFKFHTDPVP